MESTAREGRRYLLLVMAVFVLFSAIVVWMSRQGPEGALPAVFWAVITLVLMRAALHGAVWAQRAIAILLGIEVVSFSVGFGFSELSGARPGGDLTLVLAACWTLAALVGLVGFWRSRDVATFMASARETRKVRRTPRGGGSAQRN